MARRELDPDTAFPDFPVQGRKPRPGFKKRGGGGMAHGGEAHEGDPEGVASGGIPELDLPPPRAIVEGRVALRTTEDAAGAYEEILNAALNHRVAGKNLDAITKLLNGAAALAIHREKPKEAGSTPQGGSAPHGAAGPFAVFQVNMGQSPERAGLPAPQPVVVDLGQEIRQELTDMQHGKLPVRS